MGIGSGQLLVGVHAVENFQEPPSFAARPSFDLMTTFTGPYDDLVTAYVPQYNKPCDSLYTGLVTAL